MATKAYFPAIGKIKFEGKESKNPLAFRYYDAKTRRSSTDPEDIFIAHISGMDALARALETAAAILEKSPYPKMLAGRYASFDSGKGKAFEQGKLSLEDLAAFAKSNGEPDQISGKQELYEAIVNMYI